MLSILRSPEEIERKRQAERTAFAPPQISDFFGWYPDVSDPMFNTYISRKQEFSELKPAIQEPTPIRGQAYPHQKFGVRYITHYDRGLFTHSPGSGKSHIITHSAELFKNEYFKNPDDPTKINRAIILVRGPTLEKNIRNEIVCKATNKVYETEEVLRSDNETVMKNNLTRALKVWYDIMTYRDFARIISEHTREEDIENYMSNKAIFVDEAHNIPTIHDITGKPPAEEEEEYEEEEDDEEETRRREGHKKKVSYYDVIHRAFHKGKRNKIFLFTATPMNNLAIDIIPLMNLILPLTKFIPGTPQEVLNRACNTLPEQLKPYLVEFPGQMCRWRKEDDAVFASQPIEFFEPYFRGRVSYIRSLDTGAKPAPQGNQLIQGGIEYNTVIFPCAMSEFQYGVYKRYSIRGAGERQERFWDRSRQISNFVFPDGSFGTQGFDRYIESTTDGYRFKPTRQGEELKTQVGTDEGLTELSTKYATIVAICEAKWPGEVDVVMDDAKGIVFVYFPDYVKGSGAILFGLCLKAHGYEEFKRTRSIFDSTQEGNSSSRGFGPCTTTSDTRIERDTRGFPKKKRFAILTSKTPKSQIDPILQTLNSYENRYGQYIQVLIGSRTAREGISINNAVCMIMASSSWNASSNWQAEERVFRSTSHVIRLAEKSARDGTPNATIDVDTYNMAAFYEGNPNSQYLELREQDSNTIDPQLYGMAEDKDRLIRKVMRYLKQTSIDSYINYERNVRPTDVPGSTICDYTECGYQPTGINPAELTKVDRTTKILYYSDTEIENASVEIRKLFSRFHSLKIEQIHQLLNNQETIFIDMAIEKMITENTRVLDRMGFFGYLRESQTGVIYLEKDPFEIRAHPENTVYNSVLIGTQDPHNNSFYDYITGLDTVTEQPIVDELINTKPDDPRFSVILESLSLVNKVILLEHALYQRKRGIIYEDFSSAIITAFNNSIFEVPEPLDALQKTATFLANRGKSRGRKPNPDKQPKIKQLKLTEEYVLPQFNPSIVSGNVILHTLLNQGAHDRTSYGATARFLKAEGQLRILKMSEGTGWRDVNQYEDLVYNTLIQKQMDQIRSYYEQRFTIYGILVPPSEKFHIRDRESENAEDASRDARVIKDGRICTTWLKPDLIDVLYRLNLSLQGNQPPNVPRQLMIDYLRRELDNYALDSFSDKKLTHFYQYYQSNFSRDDICDYIHQYFVKTGRLFTGKVPAQLSSPTVQVGTIQTGPSPVYPDYSQIGVSSQYTPVPTGTMGTLTQPVTNLAAINIGLPSNDATTFQYGTSGLQFQ